jgi:Domain of unknown function (DUF4157)
VTLARFAVDQTVRRGIEPTGRRLLRRGRPGSQSPLAGFQQSMGNQAVLRMLDRPAAGMIQRCSDGVECAPCAEERLGLQRDATGAAPAQGVPASVEQTLREPGQPLAPATRAIFEPRFGHDFGHVRVHTGNLASASARAVAARAYTVGGHIVFGAGAYAPAGHEGRRLLAHELAHVVQQRFSTGAVPRQVGRADDHSEMEAQVVADSLVDAEPSDYPPQMQVAAASVQRQVDPSATGREQCCEREYPGAIPIWWPAPSWPSTIGDPGSERKEFDLPTEPLLIKRGSGLYDPSRPEIGRYDRIISSPPFNKERPSGWPIHHKVPLMLGGWGNDEGAAGEYGPSGEVIVAPNLVVMSPEGHQAWHRVLSEQPGGPRRGGGPSGSTPDGITFCVLDLVPDSCPEDERDDLKESQLADAAMRAGRELSEWWERRAARRSSRAATGSGAAAGGEAAAVGGASRLGGLVRVASRVAAKVSLVLTIADVVLSVATALANYAYGSIYSGTRGARLEETLKQLGLHTQALGYESGYAEGLEEALMLSTETQQVPESETAGLRQELFQALVQVRGRVYELSISLDDAARRYSAIAKRIDNSGLNEARLALELSDPFIRAGDTSPLSLSLLTGHLVIAGFWYGTRVERLYDDYKDLVRDDFGAWIEHRR